MNIEIFQEKLQKAVNEQFIEKANEESEKSRANFELWKREVTFILAAMLNGIKIPRKLKEEYWSITKYQGYIDKMEKKIVKSSKLDKEILQNDKILIKEIKDLGLNIFTSETMVTYKYRQNNIGVITEEEFEKVIKQLREEASDPQSTISTWGYLIYLMNIETDATN